MIQDLQGFLPYCGGLSVLFNDTAATEIYPLSLHDALPIYPVTRRRPSRGWRRYATDDLIRMLLRVARRCSAAEPHAPPDRKSTRLNSSHANISYAVFSLK